MVEIQGLTIYGSPWTPSFFRHNWVFNADRGSEIRAHWQKIPANLDILVTHGPPFGIVDEVIRNYEHVGCHDLREAILDKKPRVHISGHIHHGYGLGMLGTTLCINASTCNESYKPINAPVVFEI
jgi:Icc-related predicted phosphoesterase